jgi:hypothetical protein
LYDIYKTRLTNRSNIRAKLRFVLGKPSSDRCYWYRLPTEILELIFEEALRPVSPKTMERLPTLDPILRTWMLNKYTLEHTTHVFYRYFRYFNFSFARPLYISHPQMHIMTHITIDWRYNSIKDIESLDCSCKQVLISDHLVWLSCLRRYSSLQKLNILTGMQQTVSEEDLMDIPFLILPSSLREVNIVYEWGEGNQCRSEGHTTMYEKGKQTYERLTTFLTRYLSSWAKIKTTSVIQKTVFHRYPK